MGDILIKTAIVKTDFWQDDDVFNLNSDTRYIYLCLLTNPQRDITPAFKCSDRMLSAYTGYSAELINICRNQLIEAGKLSYVDGYYILNNQDYVQPSKGRDTKIIFNRYMSLLPKSVLTFIKKQGVECTGTSTSTSTSTTSGTSTRVIDKDKDKDNNNNKDKDNNKSSELLMSHSCAAHECNSKGNSKGNSNSNSKGISKDKSNTEINDVFSLWEEIVGYKIESNQQKNRYACSNLLKKHGKEKLQQLLRGVALTQSDQFAPRIADFTALQAKLNDLLLWGKKKGTSQNAAARF